MKIYILKELKWRLFYSVLNYIFNFFILLFYSKELLYFLIKPNLNIISANFIFTQIGEIFWIYYKLALLISFFLLSPFFLIQLIFFLSPGLYKKEFKHILYILSFFTLNFYFISSFLLIKIIPYFCNFFLQFQQTEYSNLFHIFYEGRIEEYLYFIFFILFSIIFLFFIIYLFTFWILSLNLHYFFNIIKNKKYIYFVFLLLCFFFNI